MRILWKVGELSFRAKRAPACGQDEERAKRSRGIYSAARLVRDSSTPNLAEARFFARNDNSPTFHKILMPLPCQVVRGFKVNFGPHCQNYYAVVNCGYRTCFSIFLMNENQKTVLFQSKDDIEAALRALSLRQKELDSAIGTFLDFLLPCADRRAQETRRSGFDRRGKREGGSDRRQSDRRAPPYERLRVLRHEMEQVLQLRELVCGWKQTIQS